MTVLAETEVWIDVKLDHAPDSVAAAAMLDALEVSPGRVYVAGHSISNSNYLLSPVRSRGDARLFVWDLVTFLDVPAGSAESVRQAARMPLSGFEDARQAMAATTEGAAAAIEQIAAPAQQQSASTHEVAGSAPHLAEVSEKRNARASRLRLTSAMRGTSPLPSLLFLFASGSLLAQEKPACPHGPASATPLSVTQTFSDPFGIVATAVSSTLKALWYEIDSNAIETLPTDSGGGKRGFWRTRRSTRWPEGLDRTPWRGQPHPGLVVTLTLNQRGDTVVARLRARAQCAGATPEFNAPGGPLDELQRVAGLAVGLQLRNEVSARYRR